MDIGSLCPTRKAAFETQSEAREAMRYYERHGLKIGGMSTYQCRACGRWHLGHKKRIRREQKAKNGG